MQVLWGTIAPKIGSVGIGVACNSPGARMILLPDPPDPEFTDPQSARYPGLSPLDPASWVSCAPDTAAQLEYRRRLIETRPSEVLDSLTEGRAPADELLEMVLAHLEARPEWQRTGDQIDAPGKVRVVVDADAPLATIGQLVTEDFCLLQKPGAEDEYRLVAAVLCFPAYWSLTEKLGKPLTSIHAPVPAYNGRLAQRVNRVFDALRSDAPVQRFNWGLTDTPELYAPPDVREGWPTQPRDAPLYLRSERQTLRRLPKTGAIAFSIRTTLSPLAGISERTAEHVASMLADYDDAMLAYKGGTEIAQRARATLASRVGNSA